MTYELAEVEVRLQQDREKRSEHNSLIDPPCRMSRHGASVTALNACTPCKCNLICYYGLETRNLKADFALF